MSQQFFALRIGETLKAIFAPATLVMICFGLMNVASVRAQKPLRLSTAIELALKNRPSIRQVQAIAEARREEVELARTAHLPRVDLLGQANRATINNVTGLILPQGVVPSISGPPLGSSSSVSNAWGSAAGALLSWEPFDFGRRRAATNVARLGAKQAGAEVEITRLDVVITAADAFLEAAGADQATRVAQATVERQQIFVDAVGVLVQQGLRPGADLARAAAELSDAKIRLLQAEQTVEVRRAQLAERLGVAGTTITIDPGALLDRPPLMEVLPADVATHPQALAQKLQIETVEARQQLLKRSYFPRFNYQLSVSARGTGVLNDGQFEGGFNGLLPVTPNIATGLSVSLPVFDIFELRARRRIERSNVFAEQARLDQITQELRSQNAQARAVVEGARRIAAEAPVKLAAAQRANVAAQAQYKFGLATITEVADAQRLLAQSEIDVAIARLGMWRALLGVAQAQGTIESFLQQVVNSQSRTIHSNAPEN